MTTKHKSRSNLTDWRTIENDREKYAAYLCSREWGVLKEAVLERSGGICERCETLPQDATHHLTYERKYAEHLDDLQAICTPCHEFTHGKDTFDPVPNGKFIHWLSHDEIPKWLNPYWANSWLQFIPDMPTLMATLQLWILASVSEKGFMEAVDCYKDAVTSDGSTVEDNGLMPTSYEMVVFRSLSKDGQRFLSWLNHGGPGHNPRDDVAAYEKCLALAIPLRERRRR